MKTIILTKGLPASGKSTWAKQEMLKHPGKYKRANKDLLREMLDQNDFTAKNEEFVLKIRNIIVERSLLRGYDVIVDDTNFKNKNFFDMCDIASRIGDVRVFEKYFEVPLKEALKRNANRENPVPDSVIEGMHNKYVKNQKIEIRDEYFPIKIKDFKTDENKKDAIVVDIDGTLALNYNRRSPYDNSRVYEDEVNWPIVELVKSLWRDKKYSVIIVSGREDACKEDTLRWLKEKAKLDDDILTNLLMRKSGDYRKDFIIKKEIYDEHITPYYNVIYVIDDRPQVIKAIRDLGYTVLQVEDLDF